MENVTEALIMVRSVMLFILALSCNMIMYTNTKDGVDTIYEMAQTRKRVTEVENDLLDLSDYYYVSGDSSTRIVGLDTVISSLYRATVEDIRIQFVFNNDSTYKWLRVEVPNSNLKNELKAKGWSEVYFDTNAFEISYAQNLKADTYSASLFVEYILTGNIPTNSSSSADTYTRGISFPNPSKTLLKKLINSTRIEEKCGIYTKGTLDMNEANMKEKKVITYYVN